MDEGCLGLYVQDMVCGRVAANHGTTKGNRVRLEQDRDSTNAERG